MKIVQSENKTYSYVGMILLGSNSAISLMSSNLSSIAVGRSWLNWSVPFEILNFVIKLAVNDPMGHNRTLLILNFFLDLPFGF